MPTRQLAAAPRAGSASTAPTNRVGHRDVPVWVSLLALALGGFAIGTTEFASMGVLPEIAGDLHVSIPTRPSCDRCSTTLPPGHHRPDQEDVDGRRHSQGQHAEDVGGQGEPGGHVVGGDGRAGVAGAGRRA